MTLIPLTIPPGVFRNGTAYQAQGRWYESDLIRWLSGAVMPVGGWLRSSPTTMDAPGRGMTAWRPSNIIRYLGIGSPNKLYIWDDSVITDITPVGFTAGNVAATYGAGYGTGTYGSGLYSVGSSGTTLMDATTWSMDPWGDRLVACASHDKKIYEWAGVLATPAAQVAGSPLARSIVVTAERVLMALGTTSDRDIDWSDIGVNTDWTPSATNAAGGVTLQTDGALIAGVRVRKGTLIMTTTDAWLATYVGQPDIYLFEQVEKGCGLFGALAIQSTPGGTFWLSQSSFFRYEGAQIRPLPCDLQDYVFGDINLDQASQFSSGHNSAFGEVYWWYCSAGSTTIDRCVSYNYRENHWAMHPSLLRTCWEEAGVFRRPMAVSTAGALYEHESGWTNNGTAITTGRYAKSGPVEMGSGDQIMECSQLVPDEKTVGQLQFIAETRYTPEDPAPRTWGPFPATAYTDFRVTGRQMALTLQATADADFRFGTQRLDATPGGRR